MIVLNHALSMARTAAVHGGADDLYKRVTPVGLRRRMAAFGIACLASKGRAGFENGRGPSPLVARSGAHWIFLLSEDHAHMMGSSLCIPRRPRPARLVRMAGACQGGLAGARDRAAVDGGQRPRPRRAGRPRLRTRSHHRRGPLPTQPTRLSHSSARQVMPPDGISPDKVGCCSQPRRRCAPW